MSKFAGLRSMREKRDQEKPEEPQATPEVSAPVVDSEELSTPAVVTPRPVGRPKGKRSNPNYQQVTVLIPTQTYREVKKRLLDEDKEVSELFGELLDEWLKR